MSWTKAPRSEHMHPNPLGSCVTRVLQHNPVLPTTLGLPMAPECVFWPLPSCKHKARQWNYSFCTSSWAGVVNKNEAPTTEAHSPSWHISCPPSSCPGTTGIPFCLPAALYHWAVCTDCQATSLVLVQHLSTLVLVLVMGAHNMGP